jgi:ATP-dependent Clp protease adaptor protein ClpS
MSIQLEEKTDELTLLDEAIDTGNHAQIVVFNDEVNTFDWVIECFVEILKHAYEQAEQLSLLIHFKGKAIVKTGTYEDLKPQKDALVERGLSAVIEEFAND